MLLIRILHQPTRFLTLSAFLVAQATGIDTTPPPNRHELASLTFLDISPWVVWCNWLDLSNGYTSHKPIVDYVCVYRSHQHISQHYAKLVLQVQDYRRHFSSSFNCGSISWSFPLRIYKNPAPCLIQVSRPPRARRPISRVSTVLSIYHHSIWPLNFHLRPSTMRLTPLPPTPEHLRRKTRRPWTFHPRTCIQCKLPRPSRHAGDPRPPPRIQRRMHLPYLHHRRGQERLFR